MVAAALAVIALAAPQWTRVDLPASKAHPAMFVVSRGVNVHGAAIYSGTFGAPGHLRQQAFVWRNGKLTRLDLHSSNWVDVWSINSSGTVVGDAHASAVVWRNGKPTKLGEEPSTALAISDRGTIIGYDQRQSVVWRNGVETVLDALGSVTAINERDQVIGETDVADGVPHAMLWQNGETTDLGSIGDAPSHATAINDAGVVVGYTSTTRGVPITAVEWKDGKLIDLGTFGAIGAQAVSVNDAGDVLVETTDSGGVTTGSVLLHAGGVVALPGAAVRAVDDDGQVLGSTGRRSFVWQSGSTALLPTSDGPGPPWGSPHTIFGSWAVGNEYVRLPSGKRTAHAVLWHRVG
jgi:probable HAF family extracellular repeat protein